MFDRPSFRFLRLLAIATLAFAAFAQLRPGGDGYYYYAYLRTVWFDGDLDFTDEYRDANPLWMHTSSVTGRPVNVYPPGTALLWSPFFVAGHVVARVTGVGPRDDAGPVHATVTLWGTVFYGALMLVLARRLLRRWFPEPVVDVSLGAVALATPFAFYWCVHPAMSHVPSAFAVTLFLERLLARRAGEWSAGHALGVGAAFGLAVCVRPQNVLAVVLFAPILQDWWVCVRARTLTAGQVARLAGAALAGAFAGVLPLVACWRVLLGAWLTVPQGLAYMDWGRPAIGDFLCSSRHGLFTWSPVLVPCALGVLAFTRAERRWGPPLALIWLGQMYVNAAATDWWAGHAFGARRMVDWTLVPMIGAAALLDAFRRRMAEEPEQALRAVAFACAVPFVLLATGMAAAYEARRIAPSDTAETPSLYAAGVDAWYRFVGNPLTWPASLPFAWEFGVAPWKYDVISGHYFLRHEFSRGDVLRVGDPAHAIYRTRGWQDAPPGAPPGCAWMAYPGAELALPLYGRGPVRATLRVMRRPEEPKGDRPARLVVRIGGRDLVEPTPLGEGWTEVKFTIPEGLTRKGPNRVMLILEGRGLAGVESLAMVDEERGAWGLDVAGAARAVGGGGK